MSTLNARGSVEGLPEWDRCAVMGVVNVTPDSFSDGGRWFDTSTAVKHGLDLVAEGADLVDVGGESTRPGASRVDEDEELRRVIPVVRGLAAEGVTVSVDTMRARVAEQAIAAGAVLVNDVSGGLADPAMIPAVAATGAPFVVMHWRGFSQDMNSRAVYDDVVAEVVAELRVRTEAVVEGGIAPERLVDRPRPRLRQAGRTRPRAASPTSPNCTRSAAPSWSPPPASGSSAAYWPVTRAPRRPPASATRPPPPSPPSPRTRAPGRYASTRCGRPPTPCAWRAPSRERGERAHRRARRSSAPTPRSTRRWSGATSRSCPTLWLSATEAGDTGISCVHPGWPVLSGRGEVLRSYALIMANTEYIQFFLTDVKVVILGDTALVTCTENILSGGPAEESGELGPLVGPARGRHQCVPPHIRRLAALVPPRLAGARRIGRRGAGRRGLNPGTIGSFGGLNPRPSGRGGYQPFEDLSIAPVGEHCQCPQVDSIVGTVPPARGRMSV